MIAPLWQPSEQRIRQTHWYAFAQFLGTRGFTGGSLHTWSVEHIAEFWQGLIDYLQLPWPTSACVLEKSFSGAQPGAHWFSDLHINVAALLLSHDGTAVVSLDESASRHEYTYAQLRTQVQHLRQWLIAAGVVPGDRVAAVLPNGVHAIVAMLATVSVGAIFSSSSPDFGVQGLLDRFGQIEPRCLLVCPQYSYQGKLIDTRNKFLSLKAQLSSVNALLFSQPEATALWETLPAPAMSVHSNDLQAWPVFAFATPMYILYSSGTTGIPKCIVHGAGGTLLQHLKELALHTDLHRGDRIAYYTTCGWMMWNWVVSSLGLGATLITYDGSPFFPETRLWDLVDAEKLTHLGTSAKYLSHAEKLGIKPKDSHQLTSLRCLLSTGSPLAHESFDYVYRDIKADLCLSSISGGTDIVSCFALGCPVQPVYRGQLQSKGLAMDVVILDAAGNKLPAAHKGELCCSQVFPSMPLKFWNDPEGQRYQAAYFSRFPGIWAHGDYAEETPEGGLIIHGRSDAVLNPGGVRIGTAEIYRQVERLEFVLESLAVGQKIAQDERIVLFVRLQGSLQLDEPHKKLIRDTIRQGTTPRHVPALIIQVSDLPRTRSGKISELAVRQVIHAETVQNTEALANPEALKLFANLPELAIS